MASSWLYFNIITLLISILTVESVYYAYTYDDGSSSQVHCCLVRTREKFCMAKPITRSLVQVNKQCHRSDVSKFHRSGRNKKYEYIDNIVHRLNVKSSHEIDDKILIELKTPLDKNMLDNDLICLKSNNNHKMNFNKCYVELIDTSDNDINDGNHDHHRSHNTQKHRKIPRHRQKRVDGEKHGLNKDNNDEDTSVQDNKTSVEEAQNERYRIELDRTIQIREGSGFSMHQTYQLNPRQARPTGRAQRKCWTWYRQQTRKLHRNPLKFKKLCTRQNDHNEFCINQFIYNTWNTNETYDEQHTKLWFSKGSKLYCENQIGQNKLMGKHRHNKICFYADNRLTIENKFTDIVGLSDTRKNKRVLEFIAKDEKLTAEFVNDCHDETTLMEINELEQKKVKNRS